VHLFPNSGLIEKELCQKKSLIQDNSQSLLAYAEKMRICFIKKNGGAIAYLKHGR